MLNEILLIGSIIVIYGMTLVLYRIFGKQGLYTFTIIATIGANIEVLIVINAFGMEMTLGNVLFASTFLITDIISEIYGKKDAKLAVYLGISTSIAFIILSQWWLQYIPAESDFAMPAMKTIFSNTPRLMLTSMIVYAIVQKFGNERKYLWIRNNGSTLVSQFLNNLLFSLGAFWGIHSTSTIIKIVISSYVIFIVTSLADTPFVYCARLIYDKNKEKDKFKK